MAQIATTIEQSKKLIELGIDVNTSDMYYYKEDVFDYALSVFNGKLLVKGNSKPNAEDTIPAWSLSALIELMPEHIVINNKVSNSLKMVKEDGCIGFCYFFGAIDKVDDIIMCDMTLIDAAFKMVCYLLKNKFIKELKLLNKIMYLLKQQDC